MQAFATSVWGAGRRSRKPTTSTYVLNDTPTQHACADVLCVAVCARVRACVRAWWPQNRTTVNLKDKWRNMLKAGTTGM